MNKSKRVMNLFKEELSDWDKKMLASGRYFKIILPSGMGEPLYTNSFDAAKEMAKEYGKGTQVVNLKQKEKDGGK